MTPASGKRAEVRQERLLLATLNFAACLLNVWAYLRWGSVLSLVAGAASVGGATFSLVVGRR